jgi:pimeloyl-ACP methyl ester carboxylesterase
MRPGWVRTEIAGKPVDILDPGPQAICGILIWLHDELGESPACDHLLTVELQRRRLRCVAPLTGCSWWVDRICPQFDQSLTAEQHLRDNIVAWLHSQHWFSSGPIALAGVGMGGQGALRLGFRYPTLFRVVASIDGALDFYERYGHNTTLDGMYANREAARQDTAILHMDPHHWPSGIWFECSPNSPWYRGNDRLLEKLRAYGVPHTANLDWVCQSFERISPMLEFVVASLTRESRRLL